MLTTAAGIRRSLAILTVAAFALVLLPVPGAHALAVSASSAPALPAGFHEQRLARAWLREQIAHDRLGILFDHADQRLALGQTLIDRAAANGKDVTAVQAALNNFSAAVKQARPIYEGMQGIMASHQGFDANGNVTDITQASETVAQVREQLVQIRSALAGPAQTLRSAVKAFRAGSQTP